MRINEFERETIVNLAKKYFGDDSKVYLFGSRASDNEKGGDIDLYIRTEKETEKSEEVAFLTNYNRLVNDRRVDLIIENPSSSHRTIFDTAKNEGILLC